MYSPNHIQRPKRRLGQRWKDHVIIQIKNRHHLHQKRWAQTKNYLALVQDQVSGFTGQSSQLYHTAHRNDSHQKDNLLGKNHKSKKEDLKYFQREASVGLTEPKFKVRKLQQRMHLKLTNKKSDLLKSLLISREAKRLLLTSSKLKLPSSSTSEGE